MAQSLQQQAEMLEKALSIEDRKWRLRTYKQSFIGSEAVDVIIKLGLASNKHGAVNYGNKLIQCDKIQHVEREHLFKNEYLYYRFTQQYHHQKRMNQTKQLQVTYKQNKIHTMDISFTSNSYHTHALFIIHRVMIH